MSLILTDNDGRAGVLYRMATMRDLLDVPADRLDDCLVAVRDWIIAARAFASFGQPVPPFIWLDDGRRFLLVRWPCHSDQWVKQAVQSHLKTMDAKFGEQGNG